MVDCSWCFDDPEKMASPSLGAAPRLRTSTGVSTICMGRKGAQTGLGKGNTRTVVREKKSKGSSQTVVKVRKVTGVDVTKGMIIAKLDKATKENFPSEILNEKVEKFMKEEAGSTMYPKLMRKIKATAGQLGVSMPDRWCYEAYANRYQRESLAKKITAAQAPAEGEEAKEAAAA
ncbi:hypothetical protein GUITHDRAFT_115039 [Guillardia theta CCMP2712]|uniref:Uncharacterized protein n=1 Tax=Guillardia theta (strain CCMP2712) TaxID=905079 RepID=L1ISQ1_GUITC|nr:hypothetical protein GUITHDRAFT_115039 [Guillardia theta CCMP2712]EKX38934.1 hypothetical protein GUITHDRAFT_115039 [Guillardia theta CCMP2712]|eukprot:XP_005825914.1 hypothetical protein GUITHDRAFT_115039 [Guillardia theta CCMP2712]